MSLAKIAAYSEGLAIKKTEVGQGWSHKVLVFLVQTLAIILNLENTSGNEYFLSNFY